MQLKTQPQSLKDLFGSIIPQVGRVAVYSVPYLSNDDFRVLENL
jgi:hypothetical protein